jgi:hypothetical protein
MTFSKLTIDSFTKEKTVIGRHKRSGRTMKQIIRQQAEYLGYEITNWDVEQIIDKNFHAIASQDIRWIRSVIKSYFA